MRRRIHAYEEEDTQAHRVKREREIHRNTERRERETQAERERNTGTH